MRSWPQRVLICAALGLITVVVVAWIAALLHQRPGKRIVQFGSLVRYCSDPDAGRVWYFTRTRRGAATVVVSSFNSVAPPLPVIEPSRTVDLKEMPFWTVMWDPSSAVTPTRYVDEAFGWPWPAFSQRLTPQIRTAPRAAGGLPLPGFVTFAGPNATLPIRPVLSGIIGDGVIAAIVWVPLLLLFERVTGRHRRRRGHCPRCDYDLRGAPHTTCPECGAAVQQRGE